MGRTQIYLGAQELAMLGDAARTTGASRSELIRRAVQRVYGDTPEAEKLKALEASAGSWSGRDFTGAEYVDAIRGDLDERLRRIGLG